MSLATRAAELLARLPPARTERISIQRGVEIVMPDGVTLLADRYRARGHGSQPVVLDAKPLWAHGYLVARQPGYSPNAATR